MLTARYSGGCGADGAVGVFPASPGLPTVARRAVPLGLSGADQCPIVVRCVIRWLESGLTLTLQGVHVELLKADCCQQISTGLCYCTHHAGIVLNTKLSLLCQRESTVLVLVNDMIKTRSVEMSITQIGTTPVSRKPKTGRTTPLSRSPKLTPHLDLSRSPKLAPRLCLENPNWHNTSNQIGTTPLSRSPTLAPTGNGCQFQTALLAVPPSGWNITF